jgi:phospholipid/cholesterol/gamma-HCH transport system substrate-binding protein
MDLHYKQEVSVGLLVIGAAVLFAIGLAWLSDVRFGPKNTVNVVVQFNDVLGLRDRDAVTTSGVKIGQVEHKELQGPGKVLVTLSVDGKYAPHADARADVASLDFLGSKFVSYSPGTDAQMLPPGQVIKGGREVAITEGAASLTQRASEAITSAQALFNERTADDIHGTLVAARRALDVVTQLGTGPQIKQATEAVRSLQSATGHLDSILSNPSIKKSVDQLDELTTSLHDMVQGLSTTTQSLGEILKKIDQGKGTIGKAANDTMLYHNLNQTMVKTQQLLDDIRNNPGRYINVKVF